MYFDIFDYPLTEKEIRECSTLNHNLNGEVSNELDALKKAKQLHCFDGYYTIQNNPELISRRKNGNKLAGELMKKAIKRARFIGKFPFVKAAFLSGSISKGYMDKESDIDFFIITEPGKLWIARTLLILFKKVFLLNSYKHFCVNYFIDTDHLVIEEKNVFTATELVTLIPAWDSKDLYSEFYDANGWIKEYYPNYPKKMSKKNSSSTPMIKSVLETMLKSRFGKWLDKKMMLLTLSVWQKKFNHFNKQDFEVAMKSRTYVSKHHPQNFQRKVVEAFEERKRKFTSEHNIPLN